MVFAYPVRLCLQTKLLIFLTTGYIEKYWPVVNDKNVALNVRTISQWLPGKNSTGILSVYFTDSFIALSVHNSLN